MFSRLACLVPHTHTHATPEKELSLSFYLKSVHYSKMQTLLLWMSSVWRERLRECVSMSAVPTTVNDTGAQVAFELPERAHPLGPPL